MRFVLSICLLFPIVNVASLAAGQSKDLLARYVNDDTFLVASGRISKEQGDQLLTLIKPHMITLVDREGFQHLARLLEVSSDRQLHLIVGLEDVTNGPLLIMEKRAGESKEELVSIATNLQSELQTEYRYKLNPSVHAANGKAILFSRQKTIDRYLEMQYQERPNLLEPLAKLFARDSNLAIALSLGPDARRVIREMWPTLEAPFDAVTGSLLADDIRHVSFIAQFPPEWEVEVVVATTNEHAAETLVKSGEALVGKLMPLVKKQLTSLGMDTEVFSKAATPNREGKEVLVKLSHEDSQVAEQLAKITTDVVGETIEKANRHKRIEQFKHLALGMLNFESAHGYFPASVAICNEQGKPLLSWRVAILPFLDEGKLFDEFRFDEPWDSEHNLKLLERMPDVYANPSRLDHGGKTTYQVPVHAETVFPSQCEGELIKKAFNGMQFYLQRGTIFREITDGTSNTIMIVEVAPERAVPWTKPVDWDVDLANPLEGLRQAAREGFRVSMADGSVRFQSFDIDQKKLRAILTKAGEERIEW